MDNARNLTASAVLAAFCLIAVAPAGPAGAQAPPRDLTALKRDYRRPPPLAVENPALVDLGRVLRSAHLRLRQDLLRELPYSGGVADREGRDSGKSAVDKVSMKIGTPTDNRAEVDALVEQTGIERPRGAPGRRSAVHAEDDLRKWNPMRMRE
jgi:hypothetical protein